MILINSNNLLLLLLETEAYLSSNIISNFPRISGVVWKHSECSVNIDTEYSLSLVITIVYVLVISDSEVFIVQYHNKLQISL